MAAEIPQPPGEQDALTSATAPATAFPDVVTEIRDRHALVEEVEQRLRRNEKNELYFDGIDQWNETLRAKREGGTDANTGARLGAKPTLEINLVEVPVQNAMKDARAAKLGVTVQSTASIKVTKMAQYNQGLHDRIVRESNGNSARFWALERTIKVGRGYYQIDVEYEDTGPTVGPESFDQVIRLSRILDQDTIYFDPFAEDPSKKDAEWCIKSVRMSRGERTRRWPDKALHPVPEFASEESKVDAWYERSRDKIREGVRIAWYWRVKHTTETVVYHPTHGVLTLKSAPDDVKGLVTAKDPSVRTRDIDHRSVELFIIDGHHVLEHRQWPGQYIPIIAAVGKEYVVDGEYLSKGMLAVALDLSRGINVMVSSLIEIVARMPRSPYVLAEGQQEGHEEEWNDIQVKNRPYVLYRPTVVPGTQNLMAPPPARQNLEPQVQGLIQQVQAFRDMLMAVTGTVDPTTRASYPYDRSGVGIEALERQSDAASSIFLDNFADITLTHEGRVVLDLIPHIYDRPGRVVYVQAGDHDKESPILIKQPFTRDEHGTPIPIPCPTCKGAGSVQPNLQVTTIVPPRECPTCHGSGVAPKDAVPSVTQEGLAVEYVDFSDGRHTVTGTVGRLQESQQKEALRAMVEIAKVAPQLLTDFADVMFRAMGHPAANEVADRLQRRFAPADDDKAIPAHAQSIIDELEQRIQQVESALEQAVDVIKTDEVKTEGQAEIATIKSRTQVALEKIRQAAKSGAVREQAVTQTGLEELRAELQEVMQASEHRHEKLMEALQQAGRVEIQEIKNTETQE